MPVSQRAARRLLPQRPLPCGHQSLSPLFTLPPAEQSLLELAASPGGLNSPCPTLHTLSAEEPPLSGHNKGHCQLHSRAKFPYPQPHWSHSGPQACQRAASLCRSQHTEYLMSDERFHLLTQEKWQNNADRDTASPLPGGLPRPGLSTSHPERTPTGHQPPLSGERVPSLKYILLYIP